MEDLIFNRLTLFWRMMAVVGLVIAVLVVQYYRLLAQGYVRTVGQPAGAGGLWQALRSGPRGGWLPWAGRAVSEALLNQRLWRRDRWRWLAHEAILVGFMGLVILSFLAAISDHVFRPLGLESTAFSVWRDKDNPFLAALHETLGLVLLAGGLFALVRRRWRPPAHLPNDRSDRLTIALVAFVTVSGYPVESLRLLFEAVPPEAARFSYIGWPLAQAMAPLGLHWGTWHFWLFQLHVLASVALFVYWPFSKLMHAYLAPVVLASSAGRSDVVS